MKPGQKVTPTGVLVAPSGIPEDEWLALRKTGIGGSDAGALLGMDAYTSPFHLYLDKIGELPDLGRSEALEKAAKWGHIHEPALADEFARIHGFRVRRIGLLRHQDRAWQLANLDRQVTGCPDGPCLFEAKSRSAYKAGEWGPSGAEDGVPDTEALQTHHYLAVTGYGHAHVGVLINGNDDRYYRIDADAQLAADLTAMEETFWQRIIDRDPPPMGTHAALAELMNAMWAGSEESRLEVDTAVVEPLLAERARLKELVSDTEASIGGVEAQLKALLGDHEIAAGPEGLPLYTWKRNGNLAAKRFREAHPDLAAKYTHLVPAIDTAALAAGHPDEYRECRARVLRISRGQAA